MSLPRRSVRFKAELAQTEASNKRVHDGYQSNPVRKGMSLLAFMKSYATEAQCEEALVALRWPQGLRCPVCSNETAGEFCRDGLRMWQCAFCRQHNSQACWA